MGGQLEAVVAGWPVEAAAMVITPTGTLACAGRIDIVRPWASVTKLLTTLATLVAVEEGSVDLDRAAGPPGATVRHLLAHASGLGSDDDRVLAPPGTRRIYSNRGFEVLGAVVAEATGMTVAEYVHAGVTEPLGMRATRLDGSPASGAHGPLADLTLLARELSAPTLISPATLDAATAVAYPGLDGVLPGFGPQHPNDWGLGLEIRSSKHPHWTGTTNSPQTYGHFGRSGSMLWVDPLAGAACVSLAAEPFGAWAVAAWPALGDLAVAMSRATSVDTAS